VPFELPFMKRLREQVLFTAGPIGSTLLSFNLKPEDYTAFPGTPEEENHDGCPEWLNVANPEILQRIFRMFYAAGCDAVDAGSFGANRVVLAEFGLADRTRELNRVAAQVINQVRDEFSTPDWPRYSIGSIGPGTRLPSLAHITWDELLESYHEQVRGLLEGG